MHASIKSLDFALRVPSVAFVERRQHYICKEISKAGAAGNVRLDVTTTTFVRSF